MLLKALDKFLNRWIFMRNTARYRKRNADHFLQHFRVGVRCVVAGFDLAGFHAEADAEVHLPVKSLVIDNPGQGGGRL